MLPQSQSKRMTRAPKTAYPMLENYRTVRLRFSKTGSMQYISHLDLQRNFARILTRAGIPIWYTKGFNPHAKLVFALPLSIGTQSVCEYLDVRIERDMPAEEMMQRLNAEMTDEMQISRAYIPAAGSEFSMITWAEYDMELRCDGLTENLSAQIEAYLTTAPIMIEKKSKSGVREIDMTSLIRSVSASYREDERGKSVCLSCVLGACGADYLNPEYVVRAVCDRFSLMTGNPAREEYTILRRRVLLADGETEFQ